MPRNKTAAATRKVITTPRRPASRNEPLDELKTRIYESRLRLLLMRRKSEAEPSFEDGDFPDCLTHEERAEFVAWAEPQASTTLPRRTLRARLRALEGRLQRHDYRNDNYAMRLAELAGLFGLDACAAEIVGFAALCLERSSLRAIAEDIRVLDRDMLARALTAVTGYDEASVRRCLKRSGTLVASGLLTERFNFASDLSDVLALRTNVVEALFADVEEPRPLRDLLLHRSPESTLTRADYAHLTLEFDLACALLRGALSARQPGINLLLHGAPGVGKTELARLLCREAGATGFAIEDTDSDDDPLSAEGRIGRLLTTQKLLAVGQDQIIVLDEAEELLDTDAPFAGWFEHRPRRLRSRQKSWKTRILEENPVPTIWVANGTDAIDAALLRRFAYTIEVKSPPHRTRLRLLEEAAAGVLPTPELATIVARDATLTPADITRARRVVDLTAPATSEVARQHFLMALRVGFPRKNSLQASTAPAYRIEWVNASPTVGNLVERLTAVGQGRLCFAGPPGTGKTALAQHIAEALDRPLIRKLASDLLDKYVGETEKALARAFEEARTEGAVLLLDEADSFLQDRQGARQRWEVTQVNELLNQIEAHDGMLILCTNHLEQLDPAVLRRVDYKVTFDYLKAGAARDAFLAAAVTLTHGAEDGPQVLTEHPIPGGVIAFGDLTAALRQARLRVAQPTAALLRTCLDGELDARRQGRARTIGFSDGVVA